MDETLKPVGKPIEVPKHIWVEDLYWYDGPLISVFRSESDPTQNFVYLMHDEDISICRWMVYPISNEDLVLLKTNKLRMYESIEQVQDDLMFVHDVRGAFTEAFRVEWSELSEEDLPTKDVYLYAEEEDGGCDGWL